MVQDRDAVRHGERFGLVVGHVDHGDAQTLVEVLDLVLHLLAQLLVQRAERLVHQDQLGLEHERARDRDPLLLTARELGRPALPEIRQLDHVERLPDPRLDLGRRRLCAPRAGTPGSR